MEQQESEAASAKEAAADARRVLSTEHARLLLRAGDAALASRRLADRIRARADGRCRRLGVLAMKAALLWSLVNAASLLLFGQCPGLWQRVINTEVYSRAELEYNRLLRLATVSFGLHNWELLHARERDQCLLPNPLYRWPLRCCPCAPHRLVELGSPRQVRQRFDDLFDRMVRPFAYSNSSQAVVTFAQLRDAVAANWEAVSSGSNRVRQLWPEPEAWGLGPLFLGRPDSPPADRAAAWLFGHQSGIRALRDLVPRPDHVPALAEETMARKLLLLGARVPAGLRLPLGDLNDVRGFAFAHALHGEAELSLALKPQCCPAEVAAPGYRNLTRRLGQGDVMAFMSSCYWVSLARVESSAGYAIVHLGSVYNGIHPSEQRRDQDTAKAAGA